MNDFRTSEGLKAVGKYYPTDAQNASVSPAERRPTDEAWRRAALSRIFQPHFRVR